MTKERATIVAEIPSHLQTGKRRIVDVTYAPSRRFSEDDSMSRLINVNGT
jgi:hypothetical protein